jgi:hypothetical protein
MNIPTPKPPHLLFGVLDFIDLSCLGTLNHLHSTVISSPFLLNHPTALSHASNKPPQAATNPQRSSERAIFNNLRVQRIQPILQIAVLRSLAPPTHQQNTIRRKTSNANATAVAAMSLTGLLRRAGTTRTYPNIMQARTPTICLWRSRAEVRLCSRDVMSSIRKTLEVRSERMEKESMDGEYKFGQTLLVKRWK